MVKLVKTATEFALSPTLQANEIVSRRRASGQQVLHMGFGQSPFPVPERLQRSLRSGVHRNEYLATAGMPELREKVAEYYKNKIGLNTAQFDVFIAPGSKLILYALQMAIEGDLLMPVPSWVSYAPQAKMLHTEVIKVPTKRAQEGYHIDAQELRGVIHQAREEGKNPSKIILNYPNNPTGLTIPEEELEAIAKVCVEEDILIISDEIYGFVLFGETPYRSISKYAPTHTAITTGLSKQLSLGGWRVGVGFIPKAVDGLQDLLCNIASEMWSCVPAPIQHAAIEAYAGHKDVEHYVLDCNQIHSLMNRYIAENLRACDVISSPPQGAFYNYPDFGPQRENLAGKGIKTSADLAAHLLEHYGLSSLPGTAFGSEPEDLMLRLSACDYDGLAALDAVRSGEALDEEFIARRAPRVTAAAVAFGKFLKS